MMKIFNVTVILLLIIVLNVSCNSKKKQDNWNSILTKYSNNNNALEYYFNSDTSIVIGKINFEDGALNYSFISHENECIITRYFKNKIERKSIGKLNWKEKKFPSVVEDGPCALYSENGEICGMGLYKMGRQIGEWVKFDNSNKIEQIYNIESDSVTYLIKNHPVPPNKKD